MNTKIYVLTALAICIGLLLTGFPAGAGQIEASVTLSVSGVIQQTSTPTPTPTPTATPTPTPTATPTPTPTPSQFIIRAADTPLDVIKPGSASYQSNWATIMKDTLELNTLRLQCGGEGDVWGINMINNPNTWATNLESLLNEVGNASLRCYFYSLGDPWGGELGINDQATNISATISITQAESYIDKLAGNNSLNHNFITDPRIALWSVSNEVDFGNPAAPNSNYYWTIQMCDYIRSKGGAVTVPYPRINGGWDQYFQQVEPMLQGHVDYLETHVYGIYQLGTQYSLGNNQYDWAGWDTYLKGALSNIVTYRGTFDMNHIIIGEFGIWRGTGTDAGLTLYNFTDQNRVDYYTNYFNAINQLGFKNVCFHYSIEENAQYYSGYCRYGMVTPIPDGTHFTGPAGQPYPGCEVIEANFG
jgi:hypothetical protein